MAKLLEMFDALATRREVKIFDDFVWYISPHLWTSVLTDSGTASVSDGANGVLALVPSDGSVADNDEAYVKSTVEIFKFAANQPILAECRLQFTEANTDDANVAFGIMSGVAANSIQDNGDGMAANFDGICIYKVDGGTKWKVVSSKATTQTITTTTSTAGGANYQTLTIEWLPVGSSGHAEVTFKLDGKPLLDDTYGKAIMHTMDYSSSPTEMNVFAGVKNGDTNNETLNIDYILAVQRRHG